MYFRQILLNQNITLSNFRIYVFFYLSPWTSNIQYSLVWGKLLLVSGYLSPWTSNIQYSLVWGKLLLVSGYWSLLMLSSFISYFFNKIVLLSCTWMVSCFSLYHAYRQESCKLFIWLWLMLIPQKHYQNHHYCLSMIQRWRYSLNCGRQTALFLTGCKYSQRWKVSFKNSRVFFGVNFRCEFLRVESNLIVFYHTCTQ
jgi:hypothetical protein